MAEKKDCGCSKELCSSENYNIEGLVMEISKLGGIGEVRVDLSNEEKDLIMKEALENYLILLRHEERGNMFIIVNKDDIDYYGFRRPLDSEWIFIELARRNNPPIFTSGHPLYKPTKVYNTNSINALSFYLKQQ